MDQARAANSARQNGQSSIIPASMGTALFWARLGWAGLSPLAPGTVATALVGIPCVWLLSLLSAAFAMGGLALLFFAAC